MKTRKFAMKSSEIASLGTFRWQNCKERLNRITNNGDMVETAKRPMSGGRSESVTSIK